MASRLKRPGTRKADDRQPIAFAPPQSVPDQPLLSIGMIFRNDKRSIRRCLDALAPLRKAIPCQLVMVDTGSTDGSRRIAEQYADVLLNFAWIGDFAAARNAGLEHCTGTWFMQLDTDEYLDPDIGPLIEFLSGPKSASFNSAALIMREYETLDTDGAYIEHLMPRLFRRLPDLRFVGAIHEVISPTGDVYPLYKAVLHHDGYAKEIFAMKSRRNFPPLLEAHERDPENLRTLSEILDICITREQALQFLSKAVEQVKRQPKHTFAPVTLRRAVQLATNYQLAQLPEWIALMYDLFPESPFTLIDVNYFSAQYWSRQGDFKAILNCVSQYRAAIIRYEHNDFPADSFVISGPYCSSPRSRHYAGLLAAEAAYRLEQWSDCRSALDSISLEQSQPDFIRSWLVRLSLLWRKTEIDGVSELLRREWQSLVQDESKLGDERRKQFCLASCSLLDHDPKDDTDEKPELRPVTQLFAALGADCPAGLAAMILEAPDADGVRRLMEQVEDWELAPSRVLDLALMLGLSMPDSFYRSNAEVLQSHAAVLCRLRGEQAPEAAREWADTIDEPTPGQLMWLYDLTLAVMLKHDWRAESDQSVPLCELFLTLVQLWLDTFYNPAIVNDEMIHLLPATLRFGWHFLQAQAALNAGDPVGYVRRLRQGLQTAPSMKELVRFLSAQVDRAANQPRPSSQDQQELMELARAVRDRVAELRAAGDPAADAIVQSEQYRLLLPLIEGFSDEPQS